MPELQWFKLYIKFFQDEKVLLIKAMPEGAGILYLFLRLMAIATEKNDNGLVYASPGMAYTPETLATVIHEPLPFIRMALSTLEQFHMIESTPEGIFVTNFARYQNIEGMDRIKDQWRKASKTYYVKNRQQLALNNGSHMRSYDSHAIEEDKDIDIEKNKKREEIDIIFYKKLLETVLNDLKSKISPANFKTRFSGLEVIDIQGEALIVSVPDTASLSYLKQNAQSLFDGAIANKGNGINRVEFYLNSPT